MEDARRFVEAIGDLPRDTWLDAAARARRDARARALASAVVAGLLEEHGAALEAWYLSDGIETAAWYRVGPPHRSLAAREAVDAARAAALAVLVRRRLDDRWFRVLYEPFATIVPLNGPGTV